MKWTAAVLGSLVWLAAAAQTPPDFAACARLGQLARSVALDRDRGIPRQQSISGIEAAAETVAGERAKSLQLARAIYDIPSITPEDAYKMAAAPCTAQRRR